METTEVIATSTDALSIVPDADILSKLTNIEYLLFFLVALITAYLVHILFRSLFNKLG